ncbi:MAG TPA: Na+/H+ antiporter NhaA [Vicinamibacterales bacterium]|nr:Na+/H+ antiporter NhaA [Vicinamibacterales bacterium]
MKHHALLERSDVRAPAHKGGSAHRRPVADPGQPRPRSSVPRLWAIAVEYLLFLPAGAAIALVWANVHPESYFRATYPLAFVVNEIAMAFFFGLVTKEIVEATAAGGVLHPLRRALLPIVASAGVVVVPALVYVGAVYVLDEPMLSRGWLVPSAIDVALAYFVARLIFAQGHHAVPFLLLLAISTDGIVLTLLGVVYPARAADLPAAAMLFTTALATATVLRRARVRSFWPYLALSGSLSWLALYMAGLHPVLALVPVLPFLPHAARDPGFFVDARPGARDSLSQFERWWRHPVQGILFFFGLVNAGVLLRSVDVGMWAVPIAVLIGRPLGILAGIGAGRLVGLHLPAHLHWRELVILGLITSAGFTIALYVAGAALGPGQLLAETRIGVLLALVGIPLALVSARLLEVGRFAGERR